MVISHHHGDHSGGIERLRETLKAKSPAALRKLYGAEGMLFARPAADGRDGNPMHRIGPSYRAGGGEIMVLSEPRAIAPGLWLTGPVPRVHNEKN
jgi:7,8-dihydropterin-6-yl-methyl-4-(beta-D-ribofuranosyl)aminobenzene 5'-phosphate synthase